MKNILVLGSRGQVGLSLVDHLNKKKYNVYKFDIIDNKNNDLRIRSVLDDLIQKCDFVYFLAFDVGGSKYLEQKQNQYEFIENNMKIMLYTFETIKKYNKKFLFTSSQMSNMSYSCYGTLKRIGEFYTECLNGVNVRFWNVYGLEYDDLKSHVITDFINMSKKNKIITMRTDGEEKRQFLHSDDCSEALEIIMNEYDKIDRRKNLDITSFEWVKIKEVADIVSKINDCVIIPGKNLDIQKDKQNEPDDYILNFWKPKISLLDGIKKINEQLI